MKEVAFTNTLYDKTTLVSRPGYVEEGSSSTVMALLKM